MDSEVDGYLTNKGVVNKRKLWQKNITTLSTMKDVPLLQMSLTTLSNLAVELHILQLTIPLTLFAMYTTKLLEGSYGCMNDVNCIIAFSDLQSKEPPTHTALALETEIFVKITNLLKSHTCKNQNLHNVYVIKT